MKLWTQRWLQWLALLVMALGIFVLVRGRIDRGTASGYRRLPDGSRIQMTSIAYTITTNLSAPPHRVFGYFRTGLPYGALVVSTSNVPELWAMFEREGSTLFRDRTNRAFLPIELSLIRNDGSVVTAGQMVSGFGSSGPVGKTENWVYSFGNLSNFNSGFRIGITTTVGTNRSTIGSFEVPRAVFQQ